MSLVNSEYSVQSGAEIEKLRLLQSIVLAVAEGKEVDEAAYRKQRSNLIESSVGDQLPPVVKDFDDTGEMRQFFKQIGTKFFCKLYVLEEFLPLVDNLNAMSSKVIADSLLYALKNFDYAVINQYFQDALALRGTKPYLAITVAISLLETVCIFILESMNNRTPNGLNRLYKATSKILKLAPDDDTDKILNSLFKNCNGIVSSLGEFRNKASGAHGQSGASIRPLSRHSTLALNLAGSMSVFLLETYLSRKHST